MSMLPHSLGMNRFTPKKVASDRYLGFWVLCFANVRCKREKGGPSGQEEAEDDNNIKLIVIF